MNDVIEGFIDECFIKDVLFGKNSVYDNFYDEVKSNNHDNIANNNSNEASINKNVNDVESTIRHDGIMIHPNSNFDYITDGNITAINEENEINSIGKVTILNELIKECKRFLEKVQKFNVNIEKTSHETDKLDDETKLLETHEDGKWKKGTTLISGDSILSGLREHKISHRRSLKFRYFTRAKIADMKHCSINKIETSRSIILQIGTDDAPFLTRENMFKELKDLRNFILKFLSDC